MTTMKCRLVFSLFVAICYAEVYVKAWNGHVDVTDVRQEFSDEANNRLVAQINKEQMARYFYKAYSDYFDRSDVALPGFAKFFSDAAKKEREHVEKLMSYVNERGGRVTLSEVKLVDICSFVKKGLEEFQDYNRVEPCICNFMAKIDVPCTISRNSWFSGLMAMQDALILERYINKELLAIRQATSSDPHLSHTLEHVFLEEQVSSIKCISDNVRALYRVGKGLGEYEFDKTLK